MRAFSILFVALIAALLLIKTTKASPNLRLCPFNFDNRFFIAYVGILSKGGQEIQSPKVNQAESQLLPGGVPFASAQALCNAFGLQLGNITNDLVQNVVTLWESCTPTLLSGLWFGWYEGLPIPFGCNYLETDDSVISDPNVCTGGFFFPVLCEIPFDPIETTTTTTSTTSTSFDASSTGFTTVFTSTETVTSFFVTHITSVITSGTRTFTRTTTTTTSCSTITIVHTQHCCPRQKINDRDPHHHHSNCRPCLFTETSTITETITASTSTRTRTRTTTTCPPISTITTTVTTTACLGCRQSSSSQCDSSSSSCFSSSSSSERNCCHHRNGSKFSPGCHDCSANQWWEKEEAWNETNKQLKRVENPGQIPPFYLACGVSLNNYFLVELFNGSKSSQSPEIDGNVACSALGYNFANITIEAMINLIPLFAACNVNASTYNSYYDYTPFCGLVKLNIAPPFLLINDFDNDDCTNAKWALCRAGPGAVVTSTVPTGPFTTFTVTSVSTEVSTVVASVVTVIETVTALDPTTFTSSSFFPVTTTTTTTSTNSITRILTSTTSCCCNPVVCTSISVCCRGSRS
jgi:hypothetical protein